MWKSGYKQLILALAESMANGIPCLARASLVTVSWMLNYLHLLEDTELPTMACSILMPQLLKSLNYDRDNEERVLASYSLLCLIRTSSGSMTTLVIFIFHHIKLTFSFLPRLIYYSNE